MAVYKINGKSIHSDDPAMGELLASIYKSGDRPLCMCSVSGVEMYVAKLDERYLIKRMPNSGGEHAPSCDSYEPPAELSGLGEVIGSAIQEDPEEGTVALKFAFSMSKGASRSAPEGSGKEVDSVKTDGSKLSLRGTLHYLWEEAGFNRWSPHMAGKRSWYVIRKYLLQAAEDKTAKGANLGGMLYMPEQFSPERKDEITQRRLGKMSQIAAADKGPKRLMLVIGEVKELAKSRYGHKVVLKHLPDFHFMMNDDIHKRLLKRFEVELGLWDAIENSHLLMIGTFGIGMTGVASLEEMALMCVTENWIPFESTFEKMVLDAMTQQGRRFTKGLRYNLPSARPLACAVASDTEPQPTAMYVLQPGASDEFAQAMDELIAESKLPFWKWVAGDEVMPPLPGQKDAVRDGLDESQQGGCN